MFDHMNTLISSSMLGHPSIRLMRVPFHFQMMLSSDDLKMMMEEVTIGHSQRGIGPAFVDLRTFLLIMEYSSW